MGRIADTAQTEIPVIWDALKDDIRVGDTALAARETYITNLIFGSDLTELQQDALSVLANEYAAKALAIELVDMSIDFWMVQSQVSTTRQPYEIENYGDFLEYLRAKKADLLLDLLKLEPLVAPEIPTVLIKQSGSAPLLSSIDDELLTPNPQDFERIYAEPEA